MSRGRMIMRAEVERNTASGTDGYNNPVPPSFEPHATVPCFVWSESSREAVDKDKTAYLDGLRAMFPPAADVRQGDQIARVTDRQGKELISGPLRIMTPPEFKHRHIEAMLERVQ